MSRGNAEPRRTRYLPVFPQWILDQPHIYLPLSHHFERTAMRRTLLALALSSLTLISQSDADDLYFQKDSTIIRWSEGDNEQDTIWRAPFMIQDVSVSLDGSFICFTKSAVADESRPEREVGYFSVKEGSISIIPSGTKFNFGAIISPSDRLIAFSYLPDKGEWKTAVFDRITRTIAYDVAPAAAGNSYNAFAWQTDSLLLFQTMDKVIEADLHGQFRREFTPPDSLMEFTVPGAQMLFLDDSIRAFVCEDDGRSMFEEFEGPPTNVFICRPGRTERVFKEKEDVNSCIAHGRSLYIGYTDFTHSKKGKAMLIRYDWVKGTKYFLAPSGTIVGVLN